MHVRAALRNGLTPDEIKEVLLQSAVYCGVPAANRAFAIASSACSPRTVAADETQVGIVGAGPAGLTLGRLLEQAGIESVIVENRSRDYCEHRIRAGVLEQGIVDLLRDAGVGGADGRARESSTTASTSSSTASGITSRCSELTGRSIVIYGQTEVVKDLIAARLESGLPLLFEVDDVSVHDLDAERPRIRLHARRRGAGARMRRDRRLRRLPRRLPAEHPGRRAAHVRARVPVRLARDPRAGRAVDGRARLRAPRARLRAPLAALAGAVALLRAGRARRGRRRVAGRADLGGAAACGRRSTAGRSHEGPILEKGVTGMRSFVAEPMQYGRLFLAGDAAHIVPPTGAKGLNLALHDVRILAEALVALVRQRRRVAARRLLGRRASAASGAPSTSPGG